MTSKEQLKELFLKLTEYTIPFGYEDEIEPYLPKGYKKDSIGNYFYEIGNSETLFTTHLDTFSEEYIKVNQVVKNLLKKDISKQPVDFRELKRLPRNSLESLY